ncbi:hypothetical protein [Arthrobacter rhizosphaerae]|uniref:hypothetical protein n=1 Tax=Arthrobacter rhizosphaerae TaxID=2855490 RepID=UPI001FF29274|nr:hypothetical protein [Arthrobacter rhizosphaerae]
MPAMPDAVPMAPAEIALWAAVLVVAIACTVRVLYRSISRSPAISDAGLLSGNDPTAAKPRENTRSENSFGRSEPDALFWNVFTGLVVIGPAVLIPAVLSPVVGLLLVSLGAAAALLTLSGSRRLDLRHRSKPENRPGFAPAAERHNAVLQKWSRYELDPGNAIDFPGMSDVRVPETAEFFRAMKEAQRCRLAPDTDYPAAVERLEKAFAAAETASGPLAINL